MHISRNYRKNGQPIDLILRLEEGMINEGTRSLIDVIKNLKPKCLPSEDHARKMPLQLKNQPQRLLILWLLLLMRYEEWQTITNYITAFSVALEEDIVPALALEAKAWIRHDLKAHIREKRIKTTIEKTMVDIRSRRENYPKEDYPEMWSFLTNIIVNIYETNQ